MKKREKYATILEYIKMAGKSLISNDDIEDEEVDNWEDYVKKHQNDEDSELIQNINKETEKLRNRELNKLKDVELRKKQVKKAYDSIQMQRENPARRPIMKMNIIEK